MIGARQVRRIAVIGLLMGMVWASGLWAQDAALRMIPADSLFCVRINNLDQTLVQVDQFLAGASPINVGMMAKMQLGQVLGNPMLTGIKTDGVFAAFAVAPAGEVKDPEVILNGLSILVPVSDYSQFIASSPKIGKADASGVSQLQDTPLFVANLGNWALLGHSAAGVAAAANALKAGPARSLGVSLDAAEASAATQSPLWIHGNIQALAKALGPGIRDKINQAGEEIVNKTKAAGAQGMDVKGVFSMYANLADTLLKETRSVDVAVAPRPNVLVVGTTVAALPGTSIAEMLTDSGPSSVKDWGLLGYCEDGAFASGLSRLDMGAMAKANLKMMDLLLPAVGANLSPDQLSRIRATMQDMPNAVGNEIAFSATASPQSKPFFGAKYVLTVKDKDKLQKLHDQMLEMYGKDGFLSKVYAGMGMGITMDVTRQPDSTYQGATIKASKMVFASKDPNSQEAMLIQKMYGGGFEFRMATLDRVAVMALGADADANIKKLIDQAKAGPKQASSEMRSALDLLPEAKDADMVATVNYLRVIGAVLPAMMPIPMPQPSFQTKSNLVLAGSVDKGKGTLHVALPKEHLTDIIQAVQQIMMQQMQQQRPSTGGQPGN